MRNAGICAVAAVSVGMLGACGDTTSDDGTGGGGGATTTTSTGGSGGAGAAGGGSACSTVITDITAFAPYGTIASFGEGSFFGATAPNLAGAQPDQVIFTPAAGAGTGTLTFAAAPSAADCQPPAAASCILLYEDVQDDGVVTGSTYVGSGTAELSAIALPHYASGTLNVTFAEATLTDGTYTPVPGGKCAALEGWAFALEPPVAGWTCAPELYGAGDGCHCNCGVIDSDCADPQQPVENCEGGQTCSASGACEGTPTAWTCAPSDYAGGPGNGCDCGCGVPDPDCALTPAEAVQGCNAGEVCLQGFWCVRPGWTCDALYYDESGNGASEVWCDCGCGVLDPDCADATVASCDACDDLGSCSSQACPGTIAPNDNATCN